MSVFFAEYLAHIGALQIALRLQSCAKPGSSESPVDVCSLSVADSTLVLGLESRQAAASPLHPGQSVSVPLPPSAAVSIGAAPLSAPASLSKYVSWDAAAPAVLHLRLPCSSSGDPALQSRPASSTRAHTSESSSTWQWLGLYDSQLLLRTSSSPSSQTIACRSCRSRLSELSGRGSSSSGSGSSDPSAAVPIASMTRVLPLPSESWMELIDCWVCHKEEYAQFKRGEIRATPGACLVGETYVLLHPSNVDCSRLAFVLGSHEYRQAAGATEPRSNVHLRVCRCVGCSSLLGTGIFCDSDSDGGPLLLLGLRLFKYQLFASGEDASQTETSASSATPRNSLSHHTLETFLAQELLLRMVNSTASRFLIAGLGDAQGPNAPNAPNAPKAPLSPGRAALMLWLINWDTTVWTNIGRRTSLAKDEDAWTGACLPSSLALRPTLQPVLRVMYQPVTDANAAVAQTWRSDAAVEEMLLAEETCDALSAMLRESTQTLPPASRRFGAFTCGFLRRLVPS